MYLFFFKIEFLKYKFEKTSIDNAPPISGLLWVHLLAGRGLRATPTNVLPGQPTNGWYSLIYLVILVNIN